MAPRPPNPNHPLVQARVRVGLEQGAAARALGVAANTLGRYERGQRRPPRKTLEAMAVLYRCPIDTLYATGSVPRETGAGTTETARRVLLDAASRLSALAADLIREANRPAAPPDPMTLEREARALVEGQVTGSAAKRKAR
jgi:transcriptional regulator with XRE-family HTH domain